MAFKMTAPRPRIDWQAERDKIDLAAVATNLLGPAPGRKGERSSRRLFWRCPFHQDGNPSFSVEVGKPWWKCFGCGEHGDAASLMMRVEGCTFPEAVATLTGRSPAIAGRKPNKAPGRPVAKPQAPPPAEPSGLDEADALALVEAAEGRLWAPEGRVGLDYLTGPRCLTPATIRAARLGWTEGVAIPTRDGDSTYRALGVVIPWFAGGRLALVKVRQPDGRRPKYAEAYRDPARVTCYPGVETIRPGRPLIIVEGETDALLLGQELTDLDVAVLTLGSASARPGPAALGAMLACPTWLIATDRDEAGDRAAGSWPARARRVRPPELIGQRCKDWTDCHLSGVPLMQLWGNILDPPPPTPPIWADLARQRWGGSTLADQNILADEPDLAASLGALAIALADESDPEMAAIRLCRDLPPIMPGPSQGRADRTTDAAPLPESTYGISNR